MNVGYAPFEDLDPGTFKHLLYKMLDPNPNTRVNAKEMYSVISNQFSTDVAFL